MKIKNKEFYQIKVTDKFIEGDVYLILDANSDSCCSRNKSCVIVFIVI